MFKSLYIWEIKKMISLKGVLVLVAVAILSLLLANTIFNMNFDVQTQVNGETQENQETEEIEKTPNINLFEGINLSKVEANIALALAKEQLKDLEQTTKKDRKYYKNFDQIFQARASVTFLEYVIENELYDQNVHPYLGSVAIFTSRGKSTQGFISLYLTLMSMAILIYGIVCGANAYGKEIKVGTLKMVMIRPTSRNKLTLSKLLAALTVATGFYLGALVIAYIFGTIFYDGLTYDYIYIFNGTHAFKASANLGMLITVSALLVRIWSYVALAMAISTVTKNSILGITIPTIISFDITYLIFSQFGLARFLFSYNTGTLSEYFGGMPMIMGGSNFFLSLGLIIVYVAIFIASTFIIFNKRDIA